MQLRNAKVKRMVSNSPPGHTHHGKDSDPRKKEDQAEEGEARSRGPLVHGVGSGEHLCFRPVVPNLLSRWAKTPSLGSRGHIYAADA